MFIYSVRPTVADPFRPDTLILVLINLWGIS